MNASNAHLYLPLVTALAEGKTIQCQTLYKGSVDPDVWTDGCGDFAFDNPPDRYRIKPEPRHYWIVKKSEHDHFIAFTAYGAEAMRLNIHPDFRPEVIEVVEVLK